MGKQRQCFGESVYIVHSRKKVFPEQLEGFFSLSLRQGSGGGIDFDCTELGKLL